MTICEHCFYRNSWDCEDDWNRCITKCDEFKLDWNTLSQKQQKAIQRILSREE